MSRFILSLLLVTGSLFAPHLFANDANDGLIAGRHYQQLPSKVSTSQPDKIELVALFSYSCPHCYRLEPTLAEMNETLADDVALVRMPAMFGGFWDLLGQLYYTLEVLKVDPEIHTRVFEAIHIHNRRLDSYKQIARLAAELGVDETRFEKAWNSPAVETRMKIARLRAQQYRVTGVPSLVVNGTYLFDVGMAGSPDQVPVVAEKLIERERHSAQ